MIGRDERGGWGRRSQDRVNRIFALALVVLFLLNAGIGAAAFLSLAETRREERTDIRLSREAAHRICEREARNRAEDHAQARLPYRFLNDQRYSARAMRTRLPIVDCTPNLEGGAAVPLEPDAQARYVERYLRGELPPMALPEPPR